MQPLASHRPMLLAALAALAGLALLPAACGGKYQAPPPLAKTVLPSGAALKPWDKPTRPAPQVMAYGPAGSAYVALTNLDASYAPGGPGLLVRLQPSLAGAQVIIDLGGDDGHACTNSGVVRNDSGLVLIACTGTFDLPGRSPDARGRAVVEVNPQTDAPVRTAAAPEGFQPDAVAVAARKIWVGDSAGARLYSLDRQSFAVADGADAAHPAIQLPCPAAYTYVPDLIVHGGDLYALCGALDGYLVRLDADTGALKGEKVLVGAQPVAMALTGDGRIAVANSGSATITLVALGGGGMTAQVDAILLANSEALQDVRARGSFLYTVASSSNTVQKIDLAAKDLTKAVVAEVFTGDKTYPWSILPLDDDQAIVSDSVAGDVVGVKFVAAK